MKPKWLSRYAKLRFRRQIKNTKENVTEAQTNAAQQIDRHLVRRWKKFGEVRRFVIGWLALVFILTAGVLAQRITLAQYYQTELPAEGGAYLEGVVADITNLNPIFASTAADRAATQLIFSSLVRYDETSTVSPDLATSWTIDKEETTYTFNLREDVFWHDGVPFTARDVVYTFEAIQHPDTRSPLNQSWQDITVQAAGDYTVTFTLPNPFPPFIHSLVSVGIIPAHLLDQLPPNELRAAQDFNLQPVGTGPFRFDELFTETEEGQVDLVRSEEYHNGRPQLERFSIKAYDDHETMIEAFKDGQLSAIAGVRAIDFDQLGPEGNWTIYDLPLFSNTFAFFNNSNPILEQREVRRALVHATNRDAIFEALNWRSPATEGPLLSGQLGFDPDLKQPSFNQNRAAQLLDEAGWKRDDDGLRRKGGQVLELQLVTQNADEYPLVARELQRQWRELGIVLKPELVSGEDLQQSHIIPHNYDILLLGVEIGVDPDVFVYWHSSQAQVGGFNLSEYENPIADEALEAGRTRLDEDLRAAKYEAFLRQWQKDTPALSVFRPTFHYVQLNVAGGFTPGNIVEPADRYANVRAWTINTEIVNKPY